MLRTVIQSELKPEIAMQLELREALEAELESIREISNLFIGQKDKIIEEILNIYTNANKLIKERSSTYKKGNYFLDKIMLRKAISLALDFHSKGVEAERESGDPYIVHPLQTGEILAFIGEDSKTIAGGILHDSIENNYGKKTEVMNRIYKNLGEEVLLLVLGVTAIPIEDSSLKKRILSRQIQRRSKIILNQRLYKIRYADRMTNLLTLSGLKSKNGKSARERKDSIIFDTQENFLNKAAEIDEKYKPALNLHTYMKTTVDKYQI